MKQLIDLASEQHDLNILYMEVMQLSNSFIALYYPKIQLHVLEMSVNRPHIS